MTTKLKRVYSYTQDHLYHFLKTEASKDGVSMSVVLNRAIELYFSDEAHLVRNNPMLRRLDQMSREQERLRQRVIVMTEAHALFVRYFLTLVPRPPVEERRAAKADGIARFEDYRAVLQTVLSDKNKHLFNGIEDVFLAENDFFTDEQLDALEIPSDKKGPSHD